VVRCGLVNVVWNVEVSSGHSVTVRGVEGIIVLHTLRRGELELSPLLEAESSSLGDSLRMSCSDGDPLWIMPLNTALRLAAFG
jgi:hypothetical protein